jgi:hypothetical protein
MFTFIFLTASVHAQKIFYAPGNEVYAKIKAKDTTGLIYTVFLIGDIKYSEEGRHNLQVLKKMIDECQEESAVVLLGDLIYPLGMPDSGSKSYNEAVRDIDRILKTFRDYRGKVFFMPGNHDWSKGKKQGWQSVKNEESYIEEHFDRGNVYIPDGGCPGPLEIHLTSDITLVVFDSQWWFQQNEKPRGEMCRFSSDSEVFMNIEDALKRNRDKKVIVATHHPLFSVGEHGGYFPATLLLFPLLQFEKWIYFPLPGFIYTGFRKYIGSIQDMVHPEYKAYKNTLMSILKKYPNVIFAAGHEHNLEFVEKDSIHHIISGAGGKATYIARKKKNADFACQCTGFDKLSFYRNGDVRIEIISTSHEPAKVVFDKKLYSKPLYDSVTFESLYRHVGYKDSTVTKPITTMYEAGKLRRFLLGNNYRNIWKAPVTFPVFDIGTVKGGLTILKRGGGMQTRSVRLANREDKQYVLRSVNKYVEMALPENMRNTIVVKPVQDEISSSNPYAALTVPPMADAVGVMHTNPEMFWVPDDPRLGVYRDELADNVFLFEERPAGNREDVVSFGRSKKIVSTDKVVKKTEGDHHHKIDQQSVLNARLLDILINDWDRHDDQWRWASFKKDGETVYKPIPRDRDQVYFVNEGPIMWLASRNWMMPKFQGFDYTIKNVEGLGFNARYFDRSFLTGTTLDDWRRAANELKEKITDSVIHQSITRFPDNIYDSIGEETEAKLRSRRDLLPDYAEEYYRFLARSVDVVGTDKRELFEVKRKENGNTEVTVYGIGHKKGKIKKELYHREFLPDETKEIRLYGLGEKDVFRITGNGKKGIKVRVIGGKGKDTVIDSSHVKGLVRKTLVYDRKDKNNEIVKSDETRLLLSKKKEVNRYDRKQFKYNKAIPLLWGGYNIDDGVLIGGGVKLKHYQFRDSTIQKIYGDLSFQTGAFSVKYEGLFSGMMGGHFDLYLNADISFPRNVDNFYGIGNNTRKITNNKTFYRVRYKYATVNPMLKGTVNNNIYYGFGPFYQFFQVTDTAGRYIGELYPDPLDSTAYQSHHYIGLNTILDIDTRDNKLTPKKGVHWRTEVLGYYSIKDSGKKFLKLKSDLSFYLSFNKNPRWVFAFRAGGAANLGDYEFYYANFLGGKTNLRGFRSNRYAGDYSFYQNSEIRFKIANINTYVVAGRLGILLFNDVGRVWVTGENSKTWHDGYGGGLWFTVFDFTAVTLNYNRSKEDSFVTFTFNYFF